MSNIQITSLRIKYEDKTVISDFSCSIHESRYTALMGQSGIGKTSIINALMGLVSYEGTITLPDKCRFSAVFQENRLCEGISVYRNIKLTAADNYSARDIITAINAMGLSGSENVKVSKLSGGMKRRVAILRAIMAPYDVLIMDEPFKGLDASTYESVKSYVKEKTSGKTVILITHDSSEALYFDSDIIEIPS